MTPGSRRAGKRGKLPARPGSMPLKFGNYLNKAKLPNLPERFGHVTNVPPSRNGWGMLGNDLASDCVIAGRCHEIMVAASATHRPIPDFSSGSALADYSKCLVAGGGRPYNPRDQSTDAGLDMQQAAKWWRDVGITDADGKVHKIDAFVSIDNVDDALMATYLCGSCGLGLAMPASAELQFEAGQMWDDLTGKPIGGHYVPSVGWMGGHIVVVTWGELQGATKAYVATRMEDGVCCLSREYMLASGLSPELIDWNALMADINSLASAREQLPRHRPPQQQRPDEHAEQDADEQVNEVEAVDHKKHRKKSKPAADRKPHESHRRHGGKK